MMTSKSTAVGAPLKAKELGWMTHLIPTLEAEIQKNPSAESPSCQCSTPQLPQSSDFAGLKSRHMNFSELANCEQPTHWTAPPPGTAWMISTEQRIKSALLS